MHCAGHNTVPGSQIASEGWYFHRVQKQCTLFRGTIRWRRATRNSLLITNLRCFCIMQDQFFLIFVVGPLLEAHFLGNLLEKSAFFDVQTGEWTSIRAWASNRDFTVVLA